MKKFIVSLFFITVLSACSAEYQEKLRKEQLEIDAKKCESYGSKRGSDVFVECMETLESARENMRVREPSSPVPDYVYKVR